MAPFTNDDDMHTPWWLWPNVCGLDAAAVALAWQWSLCRAAGVPWSPAAALALALITAGIYALDRRLDVRDTAAVTERHALAARRPRLLLALGVGLPLIGAAVALTTLPASWLWAGLGIGLGVGAYLGVVHALGLRRYAKEAAVAVGFTLGAGVPAWAERGLVSLAPALAGMMGLAAANCLLIGLWEGDGPDSATPACVALALTAGAALSGPPGLLPVTLPLAGLLLLALHLDRPSPRAARALADAALLAAVA